MYHDDGSVKFDVSHEQQGDRAYKVVCEFYAGGKIRRMMRYYNTKLDGGEMPALQVWTEDGQRIVSHWYEDGVLVRDEHIDPAESKLAGMNPREDCVAVIAASMVVAAMITMMCMAINGIIW